MMADTIARTWSGPEPTPRQRLILKLLVQEYIASANPVGSGTLCDAGGLNVSSATVRNELARLEELGFVEQPHTSAGRVPTARGYRYFVEQLMGEVNLPVAEQRMIQHQFHQIELSLDQWMRLTAAVLAHTSRAASLVTPPHAARARFKHTELIAINEMLCLLILVLRDGSIHQEMLSLAEPMAQEILSRISNKMNALLANRSVEEIRTSNRVESSDLDALESRVLDRIIDVMKQADLDTISEIYRDGLMHVLRQPEFSESGRFLQIVEILEQRRFLESVLVQSLDAPDVQIIIGSEGPFEEMHDMSLILSPYGVEGKASGVLGIMGPTRMPYGRAISTVRYVAHLMSRLLSEVYGA